MIQWVYRHICFNRPQLKLPRWEELSWEDQHRIFDMTKEDFITTRTAELLAADVARDAWPMLQTFNDVPF